MIAPWDLIRSILALAILGGACRPVFADPPPSQITVATWNLEWFFDEYTGDSYSELAREQAAPSRAEWEWKRNGVAEAIAQMQPTILALQEVENQRVLFYLTTRLRQAHNLEYRIAIIDGTDYYTEQDVAILYRSGLVEYARREQTAEMRASKTYYDLQKHLLARFQWGTGADQQSLTILTAHFRAMPNAAAIRQRQAKLARHWIGELLSRGENVIVLGDFNTDEAFSATTPGSEMGILHGLDTDDEGDDLLDLHSYLAPEQQDTHLLPGKQFDRILVSPSLVTDAPDKPDLVLRSVTRRQDLAVRGDQVDRDHWNVYYQIPQAERDLSDHYPLMATFELQ